MIHFADNKNVARKPIGYNRTLYNNFSDNNVFFRKCSEQLILAIPKVYIYIIDVILRIVYT